ncbi:MAG: hypothetical protein MZV70_69165 [Desulfobacterales bacterium]|nr:hypothetical protein [Desulfobacterales bacterium]
MAVMTIKAGSGQEQKAVKFPAGHPVVDDETESEEDRQRGRGEEEESQEKAGLLPEKLAAERPEPPRPQQPSGGNPGGDQKRPGRRGPEVRWPRFFGPSPKEGQRRRRSRETEAERGKPNRSSAFSRPRAFGGRIRSKDCRTLRFDKGGGAALDEERRNGRPSSFRFPEECAGKSPIQNIRSTIGMKIASSAGAKVAKRGHPVMDNGPVADLLIHPQEIGRGQDDRRDRRESPKPCGSDENPGKAEDLSGKPLRPGSPRDESNGNQKQGGKDRHFAG